MPYIITSKIGPSCQHCHYCKLLWYTMEEIFVYILLPCPWWYLGRMSIISWNINVIFPWNFFILIQHSFSCHFLEENESFFDFNLMISVQSWFAIWNHFWLSFEQITFSTEKYQNLIVVVFLVNMWTSYWSAFLTHCTIYER